MQESTPPLLGGAIIQEIIGSLGKFQLFLVCILLYCKIPTAFHQLGIIFLAPATPYTCPDTNAETCPCENPKYDTSVFTNTIIMEWNLICERKFMVSWVQSLYQFGTLVGSLFFGMASDRYGRKHPLSVAVILQALGSVTATFMKNFWIFTFIRFIVGASFGGTMVITFVIVMEYVGAKYRDLMSIVYQIPFNLGNMLLPLVAYFFRDHVSFQLAIAVPTLLLLSYICLAPETPRWLLAMMRTEEAIKLLEKIAKTNNRPTENVRPLVQTYHKNIKGEFKTGTICDLFRTPNIRKNMLAMSYTWFTSGYCFYGLSQYVGQLSGDIFLNVAAGALLTLFGSIITIPMLKVAGRKTIIVSFNFLCALCLFVLIVMPEGIGRVACACVGEVAAFIAFIVAYLYCTEMFPTVVRNAAMGFSSMSARVGSMIAPFVVALNSTAKWLPPIMFGIMALIAGFVVTFLLPETKGHYLLTTLQEGEDFGKKPSRNT